ncbi:FMN-binding glutamate synthase family protein [Corynebacterium sphenisci]|uniref:FMN-binding glutamate synthase family protein n=1 Tax=Corynebacterium sphenisci TaxID=191493 RepID=UPI0026DF691F|nr:FMN-binding glutamate synthase family protein [Corynebacterium sphenisci]MDO5731471.1 FMN-binding glutamate synthase family protein [Corynebacterium sphenisci]
MSPSPTGAGRGRIARRAAAALGAGVAALAVRDRYQPHHSILRNYPVVGHARYLLEAIRPQIRQYFIEGEDDGGPFTRDTRSLIYRRAKGVGAETAFGTRKDPYAAGYDHFLHSANPREPIDAPVTVTVGAANAGEDPAPGATFEAALLNVSSMSFGALSGRAVRAMNAGAAAGGFLQETGEGGLTEHHLAHDADLIWEIGSGYFGCRTAEGRLDEAEFARKAALPQVKGVLLKLSQGAKPGIGGVLPGRKVNAEIAAARGVPEGEDCVSPAAHPEFDSPAGLIAFLRRLKELAGGKPVGFKLCAGSRVEFLGILRAMRDAGFAPDWIVVDGAEGGTGAAPLEYEDHVGMPLKNGLMMVHNALVGAGLRDRVRIGASGKITSGADIVRAIALGADFTNAARAMMMATGCIQARRCNTNTCPVGVATQNPRLERAIVVPEKAARVRRYQEATVAGAKRLIASMGLDSFDELGPRHIVHRVPAGAGAPGDDVSYDRLYDWLAPGALLDGTAPPAWLEDWADARADAFGEPAPRPGAPAGLG